MCLPHGSCLTSNWKLQPALFRQYEILPTSSSQTSNMLHDSGSFEMLKSLICKRLYTLRLHAVSQHNGFSGTVWADKWCMWQKCKSISKDRDRFLSCSCRSCDIAQQSGISWQLCVRIPSTTQIYWVPQNISTCPLHHKQVTQYIVTCTCTLNIDTTKGHRCLLKPYCSPCGPE